MIFYMTKWAADLWTGYLVVVDLLGVLFAVIHANKAMGGRGFHRNLLTMGILTAAIAIIMISTATIFSTWPPSRTWIIRWISLLTEDI